MKRHPFGLKVYLLATVTCVAAFSAHGEALKTESFWNQFHGPNEGLAPRAKLPLEFTDTKNVQWRTPVHGLGWSSPVVWKQQVWVTCKGGWLGALRCLCEPKVRGNHA